MPSCPGTGRVDALLDTAEGHAVKRTGAGILIIAAAIGVAAGFLLDQALTAAGRATFTPSVTLPIFLVLLGAIVVALALPIRRATRGTRRDAGQPVLGAADRDAGEGVEHRRGRRRGLRGRSGAVPADPPRFALGRLVGRRHRDRGVRGGAGGGGAVRRAPLHDPEGR